MKRTYEVRHIDARTHLISENFLTTKCLMYLLEGDDEALLFDTGVGGGDLRGLVETLTDKPVTVVISHPHFDHVGANYQFDTCVFHEDDYAVYEMHKSPFYMREFSKTIPAYIRFAIQNKLEKMFSVKAWEPAYLVKEGHVFELGGRDVEVILTPGHTAGGICLLDRKNRWLFSGSTVCDDNVLLCIDGYFAPEAFLDSMLKLKAREAEYDKIYPAHYAWPLNIQWVEDYIRYAEGVLSGSLKPEPSLIGFPAPRNVRYGKASLGIPRIPAGYKAPAGDIVTSYKA